jgi:hypothetical protein
MADELWDYLKILALVDSFQEKSKPTIGRM